MQKHCCIEKLGRGLIVKYWWGFYYKMRSVWTTFRQSLFCHYTRKSLCNLWLKCSLQSITSLLSKTTLQLHRPLKDSVKDIVSPPPRVARFLGRRYVLTSTSFKYLDIAISVGSVSTVEIIIGDNRGTQLHFPYATWTTMIEQRDDIQRLLDTSSYSPLWIRGMAVQVYTFNDSSVFKLALADRYIYLQPSTLDYMFDLEHCIDHMYVYLTKHIDNVISRVGHFVNILREMHISDVHIAKKSCTRKRRIRL